MILGLFGAGAVFFCGTMNTVFEHGASGIKLRVFSLDSWAFKNALLRDVVTAEKMWVPDTFRLSMMGTGGVVMAAMLLLRSTFYWWPLHPLGMAAYGIENGLWFSFMAGWILKRVALGYGGGEFSQKINPFFYGLIIGQVVLAVFWMLVGVCGQGVIIEPGAVIPSCGY